MIIVEQPGNEWRYPLFDCCNPIEDCLLAYFCGSCYAGYAADRSGESFISSLIQFLCYPLGLLYLRPSARSKHYIDGSIVKDCCASIFCPCCVAMQIKKEFDDDCY